MNDAEKRFFEQARLKADMERRKIENAARLKNEQEANERTRKEDELNRSRAKARVIEAQNLSRIPYHERIAHINTTWIAAAQIGFFITILSGIAGWIYCCDVVLHAGHPPINSQGDLDLLTWVMAIRVGFCFLLFFPTIAVPAGLFSLCSTVRQLVSALQTPHHSESETEQSAAPSQGN